MRRHPVLTTKQAGKWLRLLKLSPMTLLPPHGCLPLNRIALLQADAGSHLMPQMPLLSIHAGLGPTPETIVGNSWGDDRQLWETVGEDSSNGNGF